MFMSEPPSPRQHTTSSMDRVRELYHAVDQRVGRSTFGRIFRLEGCGHEKEIQKARFLTEIRAGLTTFFTMAYIIAVNSSVLTDSGATCVCGDQINPTCNMNNEHAQQYNICLLGVKRDLITATAAISGLASFLFGFLTNMPVALAPGMGLNAYFAYQVVGYHGSGSVPYGLALAAVFIEGFVFIFLSLLGMRQWLVRLLPTSVKVASGCGIGLFLALVGLSYSSGIGAISGGANATPLDIAGCPQQYLDPLWIGFILGGVLTAYLMAYKVKIAIIVGITIVSIISWPRSTSFTYFPHTPEGDDRFEFFRHVATFHPIQHTLNAVDWDIGKAKSQFVLALFTFLYVDIIDCTATLYSMARFSGVVDEKSGDFPRSTLAYCTDAICISIGALFGCSPVTVFIESAAGITEGGKTGLTAMTTGVCFFISLFFAPIFASIPPWATGGTLVLVGCMMMRQVAHINWKYIGDTVPAFVTLMFMPFSYSIAYGLIAGLLTYILLNGSIYLTRKLTRGKLIPIDEDEREYWSYKIAGPAPWFMRAFRGSRDGLPAAEGHEGLASAGEGNRQSLHSDVMSVEDKPDSGDVTGIENSHSLGDNSTTRV
ncbi:permease [Microthyrium microscopicum]|uniref:Permease n=1 Tax=Microthyrium microscopicum TaxID=703497 RepID=A0A6A6UL67_9PEZI|nr:permease [Microthyrium microscopicum]